MSYKSHVAGPTRVFDHLYDPNFKTSGFKDVYKANSQALYASAPVYILPKFRSMFSDLPRLGRNQYVLQQNPLPSQPYYAGGSFKVTHSNYNVVGRERILFFENSPSNDKTINVHLAPIEATYRVAEATPDMGFRIRDAGCQTMYRESSAQTGPWLPEAFLRQESKEELPEIVHVAEAIKCTQLPGIEEVEIIQRIRKKRHWEAQLPKITTLEEFEQRRVVLEAFEWEVWMSREQEISDCQKLRMKLVHRLIQQREVQDKANCRKKLDNTEKRIQQQKDKAMEKIKLNAERQLRKLNMKHKGISKRYRKEDIIVQHLDPSSTLYSPQSRFGPNPKDSHFQKKKSAFTARLLNLEKMNTQPTADDIKRYMDPRPILSEPKERCLEYQKGFFNDEKLKTMYATLLSLRQKIYTPQRTPQCLVRISTPVDDTVPTPVGELEDNIEQLEKRKNILLLQRILKGRAIQNVLYKGRQESGCRLLLDDIRSAFVLAGIEDDFLLAVREARQEQEQEDQKYFDEKVIRGVVMAAKDTNAGNFLNFLENEMQRLQAERKAHAFYMLAEKERHRREAEYQKRLQDEQARAKKCAEIQRTLDKADNDVVNQYLENVLLDGIDATAELESRQHIKQQAAELDLQASQEGEAETVVNDLLQNCVYYGVERRLHNEKIQQKQKARLLAAHDAIYNQLGTLPLQRPKPNAEKLALDIINSIIDAVIPMSPVSSAESLDDLPMREAEHTIKQVLKQFLSETEESEEDDDEQKAMLKTIVKEMNTKLVKFKDAPGDDQLAVWSESNEQDPEVDTSFELDQPDSEWFSKTVFIESDDDYQDEV